MPVPLLDFAPPDPSTAWSAAAAFLAGLSVAGFALALPGRAFGLPVWQRPSRLGLLVALAAGIAAPACMLAALQRPDRVDLLYSRADGSSWIATGAVLTPAYLAALALFAWTTMRRDLAAAAGRSPLSWLHRAASLGGGGAPRLRMLAMLATAGLGAGVMVAAFRQLPPGWNAPLLACHVAATALAAGLGAVLLLDRLAPGTRHPATTAVLCQAAAALLALGMALAGERWLSAPVLAEAAAVALALTAPARSAWLVGLLVLAACFAARLDLAMAGTPLAAPAGTAGLLLVLLPAIAALTPVLGPRRAEGA